MEGNYKKFDDYAELLKALAHPVRLCIVSGLLQKGCCNVTHMQNCLNIPQSTISQHLQKLRLAGVLKTERNGLEISYSIANEKVKNIILALLQE
ncbi:MAG: ArsR/SmtB family transcription factor [Clostridiaceae bacterium]